MPGRAYATFLNSDLILSPVLAEVSMYIASSSLALFYPSSSVTARSSALSYLLPTITIIASLPRSARTSSAHLLTLSKVCRFVRSNTTTATEESRM